MTLSDVLKELGNKDWDAIEYRHETDSKDVLYGFAAYKNKMLISVDGDTYHLSDKILKYEVYKEDWLVVYV